MKRRRDICRGKEAKSEGGETRRREEGIGRIQVERKMEEVEGMGDRAEMESEGEVWGGEVESEDVNSEEEEGQTSEVEEDDVSHIAKCIYLAWLYIIMVIVYFLYERLVVLGNQ